MVDKNSNFIGQYFRQFLKISGYSREVLARQLGFNYSSNKRMICAYLVKKDYLWEQFEVENWCGVLGISEDKPIYQKLMDKAGRKKYDNN